LAGRITAGSAIAGLWPDLPAVSAQDEPVCCPKPHRITREIVGCRHDCRNLRCFASKKQKGRHPVEVTALLKNLGL